jgi:alpha-tubulin suppressor-like RCC1 family protein
MPSIAAPAKAPEPEPQVASHNNLILHGTLPQSTVVRVWVSGPGIKETITYIIPTNGGALQVGIETPVGEKRTFRFEASNAEDRVLYKGEAQLSIAEGLMAPVELQMNSTLDGTPATVILASHRLSVEAISVDALDKGEKGSIDTKDAAVTRIEAKLYDADGLRINIGADDVQWDINDPWIREHTMPCEGPKLTDVTVCFKSLICDFVVTPPIWKSVSVGLGHHACALKYSGEAYCWGQGEHGQLGVAVPQDCEEVFYDPNLHTEPWGCRTRPIKVVCPAGVCNFVAITTGFKHTCAIDAAQNVWCWGSNVRGELGNGTFDDSSHVDPQRIASSLKFTAVSAGPHFTCALATNHGVYCWGDNTSMIIPNAPRGVVLNPVRINLLVNATSVDAGWAHVCAQAEQGRLYCWGASTADHLLGADTFPISPYCSNCADMPVMMQFADIPGLDSNKLVDLASAGMHSNCAHVTTGETVCWGEPVPQLRSSPTLDRLAVGGDAYCAITSFVAMCAGQGKTGVLGDGSFDFSVRGPVVPIGKPQAFREIDVGLTSACGISSEDKLYCWGFNDFGKLGNGTMDAVAQPTRVYVTN